MCSGSAAEVGGVVSSDTLLTDWHGASDLAMQGVQSGSCCSRRGRKSSRYVVHQTKGREDMSLIAQFASAPFPPRNALHHGL
jgi:hypothetical protein